MGRCVLLARRATHGQIGQAAIVQGHERLPVGEIAAVLAGDTVAPYDGPA